MAWIVAVILLVVAAILLILFMNRYYRKATREISVVRTGLGGQKVVLDGGCIALPFLHKVSEVNMQTSKLEIERLGPKSIITKDRLRVDVGAEFYVRVHASVDGVATAAQALAGKSFRASDLEDILEGKLVDAMLSTAARYTMDDLQDNRAGYAREVSDMLTDNLAQNGLMLESVSLTRIDQTPFHALDENNAFNALGMRRLAEIIAVNKKERAAIEADADVSVRQSQLDATKRKLTISREEEEAMITQQREIEIARSKSAAETAEEQASSEKRREAARIEREREVRLSEIARDTELRRQTLESELNSALKKSENTVALALKRSEEAKAEAEAIAAKASEAEAEERVRTIRETAIAERDKALALIRAAEQAEVDDTRVKSEAGTITSMAEAEARAMLDRAKANRDKLLSEAEGRAAIIKAENAQSPELIAMKLDEARLRTLPEVVERMMKPAEKIETIRINHMTGFGGATGGGGDSAAGSTVNQVVDSVLSMALQLPAVQKLGEEVGMNIGDGVRGISDSLHRKSNGDSPKKTSDETSTDKTD
ncbi:flotillin domain-containing protein [Sedimentitalea sp. JM2-8]|uniref:Flotillin domain-containing protein n=1 Tax=Sedimentitalea xiamensis TaxID=3050037 RepID=A0ABT7FDA2_9RHOB|nr:flotillin domain-containing protein [Sedimentitalea xiamensis]MDK3072794.1 flotillin domain-containing protein [Sedimentitalea xiamensis]